MNDILKVDDQEIILTDWDVEVELSYRPNYTQKTIQVGKPTVDFTEWLQHVTKGFPSGTTTTNVRITLWVKDGEKFFTDWISTYHNRY